MKTIFTSAISFLMVICYIFLCNSCTLIGFGVGSIVDKNPDTKNKTRVFKKLDKLTKGQKIIVHRNDNIRIKGTYLGLTEMPMEDYKRNYVKFRGQYPADSLIPGLGDTLRIFDTTKKTSVFGKLIAFTYNSIKLVKIDGDVPFTANFDKNNEVYFNNTRFDATSYNDLPAITLLKLEGKATRIFTLDINNIANISRNNLTQATYIGLMTGFLIDATIITIIAINFQMDVGDDIEW
jgi:hypothetical protein